MPPYVIMWPTMRGRPLLSCVACQSRVMVPELPAMVVRSACAGPAPSQRQQTSSAAAVATRHVITSLLATGTLVPRRDGDAVGRPGRANGLLEVHLVVGAHGAGDEAHALRRHLALGVEGLHQEARNAVAGLAALGDDVAHDERAARAVLRRLPVEGDGARIADLRAAPGLHAVDRTGTCRGEHAGRHGPVRTTACRPGAARPSPPG